MPTLSTQPSIIPPAGTKPKLIEKYVGRVATQEDTVSIARIVCPSGLTENGQQPEFAVTKVLLKGKFRLSIRRDYSKFVRGKRQPAIRENVCDTAHRKGQNIWPSVYRRIRYKPFIVTKIISQ